jgi:O-antigen/teichoic acid export membrane protein
LELISSGIWNTISSLGHILTSSIDLLVANLFVSANAMGVMSLTYTVPAFINALNETLANVFVPSLIIDYAQNRMDNLVKTIRQSAKIISVICSLPLGFFLVFGREFYQLWQPTQDAQILHILSVIIIFGRVFFTGMQPLFSVFTVTNKVKENAIVAVATGFASVGLMYLLLRFTNLGMYAIVSASVICCFIKNILFVIPYAAKHLGLKATSFYNVLLPSVLCCAILVAWGFALRAFWIPDSWIELISSAVIFAAVGVCLTGLIVLNKDERKYLISLITQKLGR